MNLSPLRFEEKYFERIWGGQKLGSILGKAIPSGGPIGEAWLIADHPVHESRVADGPWAGASLRELMQSHGPELLGCRAVPTPGGRFPLLLKILDAGDYLSVQVHPDDACALRLAEPDVGKTEMWYVLQTDPGSELICGLDSHVDAAGLAEAVQNGSVEQLMCRIPVQAGDSIFIPAGTVHAIGRGVLLAEIQQNSDLTYRLYDWGRVQSDGSPRTLHIDKSLAATHFGRQPATQTPELSYPDHGAERRILAACRYFAAERIESRGKIQLDTKAETFHVLLALNQSVQLSFAGGDVELASGQAMLVPAACKAYFAECRSPFLLYYVPDLVRDIQQPLQLAGHLPSAIPGILSDPPG